MKTRNILGHIDCPACGVAGSVRITHDKNGEPFGYCEDGCNLQLRIGGNAHRVKCFVKRHPWAAAPGERAPAPAPAPAPVPATVTEKPAPAKPVTVTAAKPAPKPTGLDEVLAFLGGQK